MLGSPFLKGLRDLLRAFPIWVVGVAVMPVLVILLVPTVQEGAAEMERYIEIFPEVFKTMFLGEGASFTTPLGFMDAELFSFMAPIVFFAFGIAVAAAQIAGEEERGTLGLLLAYPVARSRLLAEKAGVLVVALVALTLAQFATLAVGVWLANIDIPMSALVRGHVSLYLLALTGSAIAFAVGAATGNRGAALGAGAGVGLASYLLNALAPLAKSTESLQRGSIFYYYGGAQPLAHGADATDAAVLLAVTAAAFAVAFVLFARRDLRG